MINIELIYYFQIKASSHKLVVHSSVTLVFWECRWTREMFSKEHQGVGPSQQSPLLCLSSGQVFNSDWNPEFWMDSGFLSLTQKQEYSALNILIFLVWLDVSGHKQPVPQPSWVHNPKINRKQETDKGNKFRTLISQNQHELDDQQCLEL